jgi:hypothetical protein
MFEQYWLTSGVSRRPDAPAGIGGKGLRTFILGLAAFVLVVLGLKVGVGMLDAAAHNPSGLDGLRPSFDDTPLHLLPLHVTGLIQKVVDRPIGSTETAAVLGCILFEAAVVGVVFELALGNLGLGLVLNGLVALTGVWVVLLLYDPASSADAFDDLNTLVEYALVGSVAAPATLILLKALAASDAATFLAGGDTRTGDAMRGLFTRVEQLASAAPYRRPTGPSAVRIRDAINRRKFT